MTLSSDRDSFRKSLVLEDFVPESRAIIQYYICPLCEGVYFDPVVDNCGHVFCKSCLTRQLETEKICPFSKNRLEVGNFNTLQIVNNILEQQSVVCKNRHFHCDWTGKLLDLQVHLNVNCKRQLVNCPNEGCEKKIFREEVPTHSAQCDYRIISCIDCQIQISFILMTDHQEICPMFKLQCPQQCDSLIQRKNIDIHIRDSCINTYIVCPYAHYGCETKLMKKELNDYLVVHANKHNLLLLNELRNFHTTIMNKLQSVENVLPLYDERLKKFEALLSINTSKEANLSHSLKENSQNISSSKEKSGIQIKKVRNRKKNENSPNNERHPSQSNTSGHNNINNISRKRHRTEEGSPIKMNKQEKTDLIEIIDDVEEQKLRPNLVMSNLANETISLDLTGYKKDKFFDTENISKGVQLHDNMALCLNNHGKSEHRYVFTNLILDREKEWNFTINASSTWVAIGICYKEQVVANKYRFINNFSNFNHGTYGISINGYSWNASIPSENNTMITSFPTITKGDKFSFRYLPESKELAYKVVNKFSGKLTGVNPVKGATLVPCIIFLNSGDEVIFDF